jgi:hypothetical protein
VVEVLDRLFGERGKPKSLRCGNDMLAAPVAASP